MDKYIKYVHKSGAKILYVKNKLNKSTLINVLFNCGSRSESIPGLAHFTEHMFFSGTKKLSREQVWSAYMDFIGVNAYTAQNYIYFTGKLFTRDLPSYLDILSTMINDSVFSEEDVEKERKIINQEIESNSNQYEEFADDFNHYNIYELPHYKNGILGTKASIRKIKSQDIKDFVNKYFVANNAEIYVVSPLSLRKVKRIITRHLINNLKVVDGFKSVNLERIIKHNDFYKNKTVDINKNLININFSCDKNRYDIDFRRKFNLVLDMLNAPDGLNKELRLKKDLVYDARMFAVFNRRDSVFNFKTQCETENINEVFNTLAKYLKTLYEKGFSGEQLKKAKRLYEYSQNTSVPSLQRKLNKLYEFKVYNKVRNTKRILKKFVKHL